MSKANADAIRKKQRKLYGKHLDKIKRYKRQNNYSAICTDHGVIIEWTPSRDARELAIREHLKGLW